MNLRLRVYVTCPIALNSEVLLSGFESKSFWFNLNMKPLSHRLSVPQQPFEIGIIILFSLYETKTQTSPVIFIRNLSSGLSHARTCMRAVPSSSSATDRERVAWCSLRTGMHKWNFVVPDYWRLLIIFNNTDHFCLFSKRNLNQEEA